VTTAAEVAARMMHRLAQGGNPMGLEKVIRRPVHTLGPDASCKEAAQLMRDLGVGCVVVAEGRRPVGLVTDRDVVVRVVAAGRDAGKVTLRDVMAGEPIFLGRERGLAQVIETMRDQGVRRLPVVDAEGMLEGILTLDDLLVLLADQLGGLAETVRKEIRAPA
jgi:CBS domain-containing protein